MPHECVYRPRPPTMRLCPALRHAPIICTLLLCVYGFRRCCTAPPLGTNLARLGLEFCWGSAVSQASLTDAFIGHVHLRAYMSSYPPCAYIHVFVHAFALCLRVSKMLYGTASGDEFAVSQACLTDAFIGHVHLPCAYVQPSAMHLLYARFCFVFTGFEDAVRHRLWGSIWHALGSNSAGVPLIRKHTSRTRASAMSTYTCLYVQLSATRL